MGECEDGGRGGGKDEEKEEREGEEAARADVKNKKVALKPFRDVSSCNTYNYSDALYWDARYVTEAGSFDWYQRYTDLRPFVRRYIPTSSTVLMVGCGNAGNYTLDRLRFRNSTSIGSSLARLKKKKKHPIRSRWKSFRIWIQVEIDPILGLGVFVVNIISYNPAILGRLDLGGSVLFCVSFFSYFPFHHAV